MLLQDELSKNIDRGLYSCGACLDITEAFDTVHHEILLKKLRNAEFEESHSK